ncbi:sugar phosphate isomerase, partial [Streptomyces sp. NPDC057052]
MTRPHAAPATPEADTTGGPATPGDGTTPAPLAELRRRLDDRLGGAARAWLDQALDEAAAHPGAHGP